MSAVYKNNARFPLNYVAALNCVTVGLSFAADVFIRMLHYLPRLTTFTEISENICYHDLKYVATTVLTTPRNTANS